MDEKELHQRCSNPYYWLQTAERLSKSANILLDIWMKAQEKPIPRLSIMATREELKALDEYMFESLELFPSYMLLTGYALENLAKGMLVDRTIKDDPEKAKNATVKSLGIGGHNTLKKLKDLNIDLNVDEKKAVKLTDTYVIWAGKYDGPLKPGYPDPTDEMPAVVKEWRKYPVILTSLYNRLHAMLAEIDRQNQEVALKEFYQ